MLEDRDARASVQNVRKNRRASLPQVTEDVHAGRDQTVSARTARCQLHRGGYYSRVAVHNPLNKKMNAHLRIQWCKNHMHCSTKMWKKGIWSDESSFTIFSKSGRVHVWHTPSER